MLSTSFGWNSVMGSWGTGAETLREVITWESGYCGFKKDFDPITHLKVTVINFTLEQATKVQKSSRGIALLFL